MPTGIRFNPPAVDLTPEIRWVLLRALGPVDAVAPVGFDPEVAGELAQRLSVGARIAARVGRDALKSEMDGAASPLLAQRLKAMAIELAHQRTIERCAGISAATSIPIVILKGYALMVTGRWIAGARQTADLDLLVNEDRAAEYHQALRENGFDRGDSEFEGPEQHLEALGDTQGGVVEVHTKLLGVSDGGSGSVGWMELKRNRWLEDLPDVGQGCFVPSQQVLAAHALAHGIAQHGRLPRSYAMLWMIGDLIDLGFGGAGEATQPSPMELVAGSVSREEVEATFELARALGRGDLTEGWGELTENACRMLSHILAGRLDPDYASQAPLRVFSGRLSDKSRPRVVLEDLVQVAFPDRTTLESVYGEAGVVGRIGQRVKWVGTRLGRLVRALVARA